MQSNNLYWKNKDIKVYDALHITLPSTLRNWAPPSNTHVKLWLLNFPAYNSLWNVDIFVQFLYASGLSVEYICCTFNTSKIKMTGLTSLWNILIPLFFLTILWELYAIKYFIFVFVLEERVDVCSEEVSFWMKSSRCVLIIYIHFINIYFRQHNYIT